MNMQQTASSRRRSPVHSDTESEHQHYHFHDHHHHHPHARNHSYSHQAPSISATSSSSSSSSAASTSSAPPTSNGNAIAANQKVPQRPALSHAHTPSGSFVRIKRKNTSTLNSLDVNSAPSSGGSSSVGSSGGSSSSSGLATGVVVTPPSPIYGNNHNNNASSASLSSSIASTAVPSNAAAVAAASSAVHEGRNGQRTIDQIRNKTCFICYEEESEDAPLHAVGPPKKWIHPCKCSLLAHEDCLLSWISVSKPNASKKTPVACPQCNTPYTINQVDFPLLNFVERVEDVWAKNIPRVFMVGLGASAWTLLSWYGVWAIRTFAGNHVLQQLLQRKSTKWILAPLVLPVLVLSRTHVLDSVLPFLPLALVLNSSLDASYPYYTLEPYTINPLSELQFSFPPNPALTLCLIPWIRAVYMTLRRRVFQAVLGRRMTPIQSPASPNHNTGNNNPANGAQVRLPGEADFARNGEQHAAPDGFAGAGRDDFAANFAMLNGEDPIEQRRVVITVASGARVLAGSLIFPGAAALAGSLLLWLARRHNSGRNWLAWVLGVSASSTAAMAAGASALAGGSSAASGNAHTAIWKLTSFLPSYSYGVSREFIDPVWWRSTVGGAVLVLLKDSWSMARQIMERRRAASRRIEDQAFPDGLEL